MDYLQLMYADRSSSMSSDRLGLTLQKKVAPLSCSFPSKILRLYRSFYVTVQGHCAFFAAGLSLIRVESELRETKEAGNDWRTSAGSNDIRCKYAS